MRDEVSSPGRYVLGIVLMVFAMWVGLKLPDLDQRLWLRHLIMHRSILTHSLLVPVLLFCQYQISVKIKPNADPVPRLGLMGLFIGLCVHFAFDLFPQAWRGYALIHIPLYGWASPLFSQVWLAGSILVGLYLGCRLLRTVPELFLTFPVALVAFVLAAQSTTYYYSASPLFALLTLAILGSIAFVLPRPAAQPL